MNARALIVAAPLLTLGAATALAGCGDDDETGSRADLSGEARHGAEIVDSNGCTACHRSGGAAASFDGLYGSTVELDAGTTVIADDDYLTRAITDPGADAHNVDGLKYQAAADARSWQHMQDFFREIFAPK